jgi:DNA-binding transcriptional LysR family regulator
VPLPERLTREPLLRLGAGSQGRWLLEDYLARERIQPTSTIDVPSVSLLLAYVSGGLGVGLVPALALAELDHGRVRWERAAVPALPVMLVHRPGFRRGAAAGRFAARLVTECRARRSPPAPPRRASRRVE